MLPFVFAIGGLVYAVTKEQRDANVIFDALESRLQIYPLLAGAPSSRYGEIVTVGVLGPDVPTDPPRRAAAAAARDSGRPVVTATVTPQGLVVFRPLYRVRAIPGSRAARRESFTGWSYTAFRPVDLLRAVGGTSELVELELYDLATSSLLATTATKEPRREGSIEIRAQREIRPFGRAWLVRQLRRTPVREALLSPKTMIWLALVIFPVLWLARPQRYRRSFELGPTMLDSLVDVIAVLDLKGKIVYVAPSIRKNFDYLPEDVLNHAFADFVHPDDERKLHAALLQLQEGESGEVTERIRVHDRGGAWHHVEATGRTIKVRARAIAVLLTLHDVTSAVSAQEALWVSEERFRRLFDSIQDYAIAIVDQSGSVVSWNEGATRMTQYSAEEMAGQSIAILYPEERRDRTAVQQELSVVAERGSVEVEEWRVRKDGTRFLAQIIHAPMSDRFGRPSGFSMVMRDVTERRMTETQLAQAQRLDSLGKLAGGIAHDFNNLLMVVQARVEMLLRGAVDAQRRRRYLEDIRTAAERGRNLTQQLLAAARKQVLQPEVIDLNEVVSSTMRLLSSSIGEDIRIRTQLDRSLWPVYADPGKLHQVLMNLALNSRDAMPNGGTLTIETRNFHAVSSYVVQHRELPEGDHAMLLVSDTGQGIPAEAQQRIFDPFFSTKATGTGLGLAVVKGIVEQTGGQIWVYSEVGKGTTFRIFFPRHEESAVAETPDAASSVERGTETILLVEDEEMVRTIVRETLEEAGYRVLEAASPDEALTLEVEHAGPIDLLLTDVVMPVLNGKALAQRILEKRPGLHVLFMSGYTDDVVMHHGVLEKGQHFVEKPAEIDVLLRAVRNALDS